MIAKSIVVQGKVDGSISAADRLDLRKSAIVTGDVTTQRIAIEEGAFLKGNVDIQKEAGKGTAAPASEVQSSDAAGRYATSQRSEWHLLQITG